MVPEVYFGGKNGFKGLFDLFPHYLTMNYPPKWLREPSIIHWNGFRWVFHQSDHKDGNRLAQFLLIFCPTVKPVEMDLYHFQFHYPLFTRWLKEKSLCLETAGKIWANKTHFEKLVNICSFSPLIFCPFLQVCNKFEHVLWMLLK